MNLFKIPRIHWRHFFGGFSFLIIILQLATGIFLIFFYDPTRGNAYKSVQYLTNVVTGGSLMRNLHRWIAFSIFLTVLIHTIRSTLRKDFLMPSKRILWMTGVLLLMPILLLTFTGLILPWEWKGYWFMEMVPNYAEVLPYVGPFLKTFLIDAFTLPRTFAIHVLILPLVSLILIDYHFLTTLRKRGVFKYLLKHTLITLPFTVLLIALAIYVTIPSQDPKVIPLPLEGAFVPAPEWHFLIVLLPFLYYKGTAVLYLSIYIPLTFFLVFTFFPFFLKRKTNGTVENGETEEQTLTEGIRSIWGTIKSKRLIRKTLSALAVLFIFGIFTSLLFMGTYNSPTLGCNGCHHLLSGQRMGIPPEAFKDRRLLPNLNRTQWMMGHWFYPTQIW